MERISARVLATAIRLIREPVVVTYSYPRNHSLYGAGEELGVFLPMAEYRRITGSDPEPGVQSPHARDPHDA